MKDTEFPVCVQLGPQPESFSGIRTLHLDPWFFGMI